MHPSCALLGRFAIGLRCYGNITRTRNVSEYMLVLALCLVTRASLARTGISCRRRVCLSVRPSVRLSQLGVLTKHNITQTTPHDSPGTLVFCRKSRQPSIGITPNGGTKCRWGRLNAGEVAENRRLSMQVSVASLLH